MNRTTSTMITMTTMTPKLINMGYSSRLSADLTTVSQDGGRETRAALGAIFLAILIAGCLSRAHPGGASALAGTSAAVRETPVTPGITVPPIQML